MANNSSSGSRHLQSIRIALLLLTIFFPAFALAGEPFEATGELSVSIAENFAGGAAIEEYALKVSEQEFYRLFIKASLPEGISNGDVVRVSGELVQDAQRGRGVVVSEIALVMARSQQIRTFAVQGQKKVVVIIANFNDRAVGCSSASVAGYMWTGARSVDGLFQATSFGQLSFPRDTNADGQPDIVSVSINHNAVGGGCDYLGWATSADTAATGAGVNLNLYQHRIYVLPEDVECGWAGLGNVGCLSGCRVWVKNCNLPDVYAHELGHNLGLNHARTDENNDGVTDCEYCDGSCIMGYGGIGWRHFNAMHQEDMGWIGSDRQLDITANGTYQLVASDVNLATVNPLPPTDTQILAVPVPQSPADNYYISYRVAADTYSDNLWNEYRNRTHIHRSVSGNNTYSYFIRALANGETFNDGRGVVITQVSQGSNYANVYVDVGVEGTPTPTPVATATATHTPNPLATATPTPTPTRIPATPTPGGGGWNGAPTPIGTAVPTPVRHGVRGRIRGGTSARALRNMMPNVAVVVAKEGSYLRPIIVPNRQGVFSSALEEGQYRLKVQKRPGARKSVRIRSSWIAVSIPDDIDRELILSFRW